MYSQQASRPGAPTTNSSNTNTNNTNINNATTSNGGSKGSNRYMKGRLPEGVDFAAYPGRSSTPLPTAESKSAERINQLKIWNEAATNDEKRRLNAAKSKGASLTGGNPATTRRTDSYKEARDRQSASFHGAPPQAPPRNPIRTGGEPLPTQREMFADRSDSESDGDNIEDDPTVSDPMAQHHLSSANPYSANSGHSDDRDEVDDTVDDPSPTHLAAPQAMNPVNSVEPPAKPAQVDQVPTSRPVSGPPPKESKACCVIM